MDSLHGSGVHTYARFYSLVSKSHFPPNDQILFCSPNFSFYRTYPIPSSIHCSSSTWPNEKSITLGMTWVQNVLVFLFLLLLLFFSPSLLVFNSSAVFFFFISFIFSVYRCLYCLILVHFYFSLLSPHPSAYVTVIS